MNVEIWPRSISRYLALGAVFLVMVSTGKAAPEAGEVTVAAGSKGWITLSPSPNKGCARTVPVRNSGSAAANQ